MIEFHEEKFLRCGQRDNGLIVCHLPSNHPLDSAEVSALIQEFWDNHNFPLTDDKVRAVLLDVALDTF